MLPEPVDGLDARLGHGATCSRVLSMIFAHESVPLQAHAFTRSFIDGTPIEVGIAESDIGLALLEQSRVVHDSSTVRSDPSLSGLLVAQPERKPSAPIRTK